MMMMMMLIIFDGDITTNQIRLPSIDHDDNQWMMMTSTCTSNVYVCVCERESNHKTERK